MKKIIPVLLALLMCIPTVAFADDMPEYKVKYMCPDIRDVSEQIAREVVGEDVTIEYLSSPPQNFNREVILQVNETSVKLVPVMPKYADVEIPTIAANDQRNDGYQKLDEYIRSCVALTQVSEEYEAARGTAPIPSYSLASVRQGYVPTGTKYSVMISYDGGPSYANLTVTGVDSSAPRVQIVGQGIVQCEPENVEMSTDRKQWSGVRNGQSLSSKYYGQTIYFRTPASGVYDVSSDIQVYVKDQQQPPTGKLELTSNSYSVTITNPEQFKGCRFSINGTFYSTNTTFTNLQPNTKYTVYAKYPEDDWYFESQPVQASIDTTAAAVNKITYTSVSTSDTIYYQAVGTAALTVSGKTLQSTYTNTTVNNLKNDINKASKKSDVVTTLDVSMKPEDSDNRDYDKIHFQIPAGMGLLRLNLETPWFTVVRTEETTSIRLQEGTSAVNSSITEWKKGKGHIYTVNINNYSAKAGTTTIIFPWKWPDRADLDGLEIHYCSRDGKTQQQLTYSVTTKGVQFTMPDSGFFAIKNLNRPYGKLPFLDSQTSWAYSYIYHAYETGLVNGTSATEFSPSKQLTRAEVCTLLSRLAGADLSKAYCELPYSDVKDWAWYYNAISYICSLGALPKTETVFGPNEPITRADMCALTNIVFPYEGVLWTPFNCDDRADIPTYALKAVDSYYTCGVIKGMTDTTFNPTGYLTRAEMVTILYRLQTLGFGDKE